jgi:hypothetical protein
MSRETTDALPVEGVFNLCVKHIKNSDKMPVSTCTPLSSMANHRLKRIVRNKHEVTSRVTMGSHKPNLIKKIALKTNTWIYIKTCIKEK